MLKFTLVLCLALAASAIPVKDVARDEVVIKGTAGVTYFNVKGMLVPVMVPNVDYRTFFFQTEDDMDLKEDDFVTFKCMPLQEVYVANEDTHKTALFCRGSVFEDDHMEKKVVFLFATDGLTFTPEEKEVHLKLGTKTVSHLIQNSFVGDRVKRQFGGGGFSGSGAQAGASSFGSGFGGGGFPGGFGGGMSGSQAQAGASSFGGGSGFFG